MGLRYPDTTSHDLKKGTEVQNLKTEAAPGDKMSSWFCCQKSSKHFVRQFGGRVIKLGWCSATEPIIVRL